LHAATAAGYKKIKKKNWKKWEKLKQKAAKEQPENAAARK